jgi:hypothetical protein
MYNGSWENSELEAALSGINGALVFDSFFPLTSPEDQHVSIQTASFSSFETTDSRLVFRILNADSIMFKSAETRWAKGKLSSKNFLYETAKSSLDFVLLADSLDLQAILDFFEYGDVKGAGKIFGQLALRLDWQKKGRLELGEGFLEARPQTGRLQLSKETAMKILGITREIDPKTSDDQEVLQLMMLRALQDMEYTALKILFSKELEALKTQVKVQGYGPFNDPENRIPIGGLTVNINQLDVLLNDILLSN